MQAEKSNKEASLLEVQPPKEENLIHTLLMEIRDTLVLLDKSVTNKETRVVSKLTKQVRKYRHVIKPHHLIAILEAVGFQSKTDILKRCQLYNQNFTEKFDTNKNLIARIGKVFELQIFLKILLVEIWWREGQLDECLNLVNDLLGKITLANRRTLDNYNALLYHFYSRIHEKKGTDGSIREHLLDSYNRACVRSDEISQSTILNLLLRNYLKSNNMDAAYNLIQKTSFPESKSNNEFCKFLYYTGKIKAVRRQYSDALSRLNQAIRKSPDNAKGFKIHCQKLAIVVELLQGDIPNREIFADVTIFTNTYQYYKLIQAVIEGELGRFNQTVEEWKAIYQKDKTYTIILRLNQIVVRIGLRRISLAYSKISLKDIAFKLNIPNQDVEFVVAKALRDGIMHGEIDHDNQILNIQGDQNIYVTNEPQLNLNKRIQYCLNLYHETQKAITYPDMKMNVQESKEAELDASELLGLLDFDDDDM